MPQLMQELTDMPATVFCPACKRQLRLPDALMGKSVRCPICSETFTATESENALPMAALQNDAPENYEGDEPPPDRSRRRMSVDEEDEQEDDDDYEDLPRRRGQGSRAAAKSRVMAPAICLMVTGGLGLLGGIANVIFNAVKFLGGGAAAIQPQGQPAAQHFGFVVGVIIGISVVVILPIVVLAGGWSMLNLRNRGAAMTAAIVAMIPCHYCFFLGIPFGIWALVVLNDDKVRRAFN